MNPMELFEKHKKFALWLANKFCVRRGIYGEDRESSYADAMIGLWKACLRFEPGRGLAFTTFAWPTIYGTMQTCRRKEFGPARRFKTNFCDFTWESLPDTNAENEPDRNECQWVADQMIACLNRRERTIVMARARGETLDAIAAKHHVTRERIRQIIDSAYKTILMKPKNQTIGMDQLYEHGSPAARIMFVIEDRDDDGTYYEDQPGQQIALRNWEDQQQ